MILASSGQLLLARAWIYDQLFDQVSDDAEQHVLNEIKIVTYELAEQSNATLDHFDFWIEILYHYHNYLLGQFDDHLHLNQSFHSYLIVLIEFLVHFYTDLSFEPACQDGYFLNLNKIHFLSLKMLIQ